MLQLIYDANQGLNKIIINSNSSELMEGNRTVFMMYEQRPLNYAFLELQFQSICPNISFKVDEELPIYNKFEVVQNDQALKFDISDYIIEGIEFNCVINETETMWRTRTFDFLNRDEFNTSSLKENSTQEVKQELLVFSGTQVTINPPRGRIGINSALLMLKQRDGNVAYLEFDVKVTRPNITLSFLEPKVVKEPEPEPEPEPEAPPIIWVVIVEEESGDLESRPLSAEELEEAMSSAPKKDAGGAVAIGPWRPEWQNKASKEDAKQALSGKSGTVSGSDTDPPVEINIGEITRDGKIKLEFN